MPPIPATSNILVAKYEGTFGSRTVSCRFSDATSATNAAIAFRTYLVGSVLPLWSVLTSVTQWSWRAKGDTFSLPIASPGPAVGTNGANVAVLDHPRFLSVSARGLTDGKEARMFFYGLVFPPQNDFRFNSTDSLPVAALWSGLQALINAGGFRTKTGGLTTPRVYANQGISAFYQRKARGSA